MLFGQEVSFTDINGAIKEWDGSAEEIEEVQYSENARGRGKKRRRVTGTVRKFIARAERYKNKADDPQVRDQWEAFCKMVDNEYAAMLETKNILREQLDNVW